MTSAEIHTLTGAYALDALPRDEARLFEAHLTACEVCRQEVSELRATAARLAAAAAEPAPARLRGSVLAAIDVTPQERLAPVLRRPGGWPGWAQPSLAAAAAAAVLLIVGLGAVVVRLNDRLVELEAQTASAYQLLAAEDVETVSLTGEGPLAGRVIVSRTDGAAMLVASGLPRVGSDQVYELWLIGDEGPRPAALFHPDDRGRAVQLLAELDLRDVRAFGVTVEPAGGSLQPTTDPVLLGSA